MKKREKEIVSNPVFLAAVFMDVKHLDLLSPAQKRTAEAAVLNLVLKINSLELPPEDTSVPSPSLPSASHDSESDEEIKAAVMKVAVSDPTGRSQAGDAFSSSSSDFETEIVAGSSGSGEPPAKRKKEPTSWELCTEKTSAALKRYLSAKPSLKKLKLALPEVVEKEYCKELKKVAGILSSILPTQVSVERLFSALKILKTDL